MLQIDNVTGDSVINLILAVMGQVYCMDECMSCYRKVTDEDSSSFSAMQEHVNNRDRLYKGQIELENIIYDKFQKRVSFEKRKKNIFASAVFKWNRERNERNKDVVDNIIKYSGQPILYRIYKIYLLVMKKVLKLIYGEDRRVPF